MIFCKNCGTQIDDGQLFCPACGQAVDAPADAFDANGQPQNFDSAQDFVEADKDNVAQQPPVQNYGYDNGANNGYNGANNGYNGMNGGYNNGYNNGGFGGAPNMGFGTPVGPSFGLTEKNIVTCILLTIITCGIYGLYWYYTLTEDTNKLSNEPNPTSGGMAILLSIVTCGIYTYYWMYKKGEIIDNYYMSRGQQSPNNSVIYLVLTIVGFGIVSYGMLQNELNRMARGEI